MKNYILGAVTILALCFISMTTFKNSLDNEIEKARAPQYKIITSVESIVPNGMGRSRIISSDEDKNYQDYTTNRSGDKNKNEKNKSDRGEIRISEFQETKLLNFYNLGGIRFQNIAANDALIGSKLNDMVANGWELAYIVPGVESEGGKGDGKGIFITRYIFKK